MGLADWIIMLVWLGAIGLIGCFIWLALVEGFKFLTGTQDEPDPMQKVRDENRAAGRGFWP